MAPLAQHCAPLLESTMTTILQINSAARSQGANSTLLVNELTATPQQAAISARSEALIAELQAADIVVIGAPMYNFGISSQLKTYFDFIARAGITFQYSANGPEGLVKGKKVYVVSARGGKYLGTSNDSQTPYLKSFLGFLGMTDVNFIYAEGLNMGPDAAGAALASAREAIAAA